MVQPDQRNPINERERAGVYILRAEGSFDEAGVRYVYRVSHRSSVVCGLPLGSPDFHRPAAMANLLGDLWEAGEPDWAAALADSSVKLHLYGKSEPRSGRKMGHINVLAESREELMEKLIQVKAMVRVIA